MRHLELLKEFPSASDPTADEPMHGPRHCGPHWRTDRPIGRTPEISSASPDTIHPSVGVAYPSPYYPPPGANLNGTPYPAGITVTQPGGAPLTFYPQGNGGNCTLPQVTAGQYCVTASSGGASLTSTSSDGSIIS